MVYCFMFEFFIFRILANERMSPSTMDNEAANSTLYCPGSRKVMVWAGIQNTGMVTPTISLMNRPQSIWGMTPAKVTFSPE